MSKFKVGSTEYLQELKIKGSLKVCADYYSVRLILFRKDLEDLIRFGKAYKIEVAYDSNNNAFDIRYLTQVEWEEDIVSSKRVYSIQQVLDVFYGDEEKKSV